MTAARSTRLTLHCPGLLAPPLAGAAQALPPAPGHRELARFLSRAAAETVAQGVDPAASLFRQFGLAADPPLPVAPLTRLADEPEAPAAPCLRADPVHLRPGLNGVTLFDAAALDLEPPEATALAAELRPLFAEHGLALEAPVSGRWYVVGAGLASGDLDLGLADPSGLSGRDVSGKLPGGPRAALWRGLLTEAQMTLHEAAANAAREDRGAPPVNSLWLWGGGQPPIPGAPSWQAVWGHDPLLVGLARHHGVPVAALPPAAELVNGDAGGSQLVHLPRAAEAVAGDLEGWAAALEDVARDWLVPLGAALGQGRLAALTLDTGSRRYTAQGRALRRWWRRPRPLAEFLEEGAR